MSIFSALNTGIARSIKAWKGLMVIWFFYLLMVAILASPMKSAFSSGLGNSMITQLFSKDMNIEFLTDMGASFRSIMAFFRTGLLIMLLVNIPVNAFFTGGMYKILANENRSVSEFLEGAARSFWSFFVISLIMSLIVLASFLVLIILPVSIMISGEQLSDAFMLKTGVVLFIIFFMWLAVVLLVSDLARAWQASFTGNRSLAAIGYGFRHAFRMFLRGWPMMLMIMIIQCLFVYIVAVILRNFTPVTSIGVFLLFIISQLLFFMRIFLRTVRYGSVISLAELKYGM